jgi:Gas vesicle synthesis protein GvpL/GvpF
MATFLYGVVPADVEPTGDARAVGDPPGRVTVVTHRDIGALTSEVSVEQPLGRPDELRSFQRLLDGTAAVAPVLPMRFGTVLTDEAAVADLLAQHHDDFRAALDELEGRVEFVVHGRYDQTALLTEVLTENAEVRGLRGETDVAARTRLGELVNQAVEVKRATDTEQVAEILRGLTGDVLIRPATHELDAVNIAVLVDAGQRGELEEIVRRLGDDWSGRVGVRMLGPLAPYDFATPMRPEES